MCPFYVLAVPPKGCLPIDPWAEYAKAEEEVRRQEREEERQRQQAAEYSSGQTLSAAAGKTASAKRTTAVHPTPVRDVLLSWTTQSTVALLSGIYPDAEGPAAGDVAGGEAAPAPADGMAPGPESDNVSGAIMILPDLDSQQQVQVRRKLVNQHLDKA